MLANTALLIIDVQLDYFSGGKKELEHADKTAKKISFLLDAIRKKQMIVIHVKHISKHDNASFLAPNTLGTEIHPLVMPINNEIVIVKQNPDSFLDTQLHDYLKKHNIRQLIIVGMMTHVCVNKTTIEASRRGYQCVVVGDCCTNSGASIDDKYFSAKELHTFYLKLLSKFASITNLNETLDLINNM